MVVRRKTQPTVGDTFITRSERTGVSDKVKITKIEGSGKNKVIHYKYPSRLNPYTKKPETGKCNQDWWKKMNEWEEN